MSNEYTLEVRLYNADNSGYAVLPLASGSLPGVLKASARVTLAEGYSDGQMTLTGVRTDFPLLYRRRRIAFYGVYRRRSDDSIVRTLLWRGIIKRILPLKDKTGVRTIDIKAYGLWSEVSRVRCYKNYANSEGADRADFFADLAKQFVIPAYPSLVAMSLPIGSIPEYFSAYDKTFGESADALRQNVGQVATGCDADPFTDADRIFFRPFDDLAQPARHTIILTDTQTSAVNIEEDDSGQVTVLTIIGGVPRGGGNLLAEAVEGNTSFENPQLPGSENFGNYVLNGSFESGADFWEEIDGGTTRRTDDEGVTPFSGEGYAYFGNLDAALEQTVWDPTSPLVPGKTYKLDCRARVENEAFLAAADITLKWINGTEGSHTTVSTQTITVNPSGTVWDLFGENVTPPATANAFTINKRRTTSGASSVLFIDDFRFYDPSQVTQKGWELFKVGGDPTYNLIDWQSDLSPWHGGRCVFFDITSEDVDGRDVQLRPFGYNRHKVTGGTTLVAGYAVRVTRAAGGTLKLQVGIETWATDGHGQGETVTSYNLPADGVWRFITHTRISGGDTAQATCRLMWRGDGAAFVDAAFNMDDQSPFAIAALANVAGGVMPDPSTFVEGNQFRARYRATDLYASGTAIGDEARSIGDIEATETISEIVSTTDSETYARAYFERYTLSISRPSLDSAGILETGATTSTATMMPGESVRFLGTDGVELLPNPLPCAEKVINFEGGKLVINPLYSAEPRNPYRTIEQMIRAARLSGTTANSGSSSNGLSGGAGSAGGGYGGSGTVTSVGLSTPSLFSVSGSPVTASGTLAFTFNNANGYEVLRVPSGTSAPPAMGLLTSGHIPSLDASKITTGTLPLTRGGTGGTDAPSARSSLGLGTAAIRNIPAVGNASATEVVLGNDTRLLVSAGRYEPISNGDLTSPELLFDDATGDVLLEFVGV